MTTSKFKKIINMRQRMKTKCHNLRYGMAARWIGWLCRTHLGQWCTAWEASCIRRHDDNAMHPTYKFGHHRYYFEQCMSIVSKWMHSLKNHSHSQGDFLLLCRCMRAYLSHLITDMGHGCLGRRSWVHLRTQPMRVDEGLSYCMQDW